MNAQAKYNENRTEIETLMTRLKAAMESHQRAFDNDNGNWGLVGDLGMVKSELAKLEGFIISAGVKP